jgi:hypothetical protein
MKMKKIELLFHLSCLQSGLTATQASKVPKFQLPDLAFQSIHSILRYIIDSLFHLLFNGTLKSIPSKRGQVPHVGSHPHGWR